MNPDVNEGRRVWLTDPAPHCLREIRLSRNYDVSLLVQRLARLEKWFQLNGLLGWDPYDIKDTQLFRFRYRHARKLKVLGPLLDLLTDALPESSRWLLRVRPQLNAKALGLLISSYVNLYEVYQDVHYLDAAKSLADLLLRQNSSGCQGLGWGYPFNWHSVRYIPKYTPSSVVTSTIADGFFRLFGATKDCRYIEVCLQICRFFEEDLRITYDKAGARCYSYTPIDDYRVHNANLFVAEFLTRMGKYTAMEGFTRHGIQAGQFALQEQTEEGYLPYWSRTQTYTHSGGSTRLDHYHSGFEIRCLYAIGQNTGVSAFSRAAQRYFEWYKTNLYTADGMPKHRPDNVYPINIHSLAEAILCTTVFSRERPQLRKTVLDLASLASLLMEYEPGAYRHQIRRVGKLYVGTNLAMVRWGQAWMFRALSEALYALKRD